MRWWRELSHATNLSHYLDHIPMRANPCTIDIQRSMCVTISQGIRRVLLHPKDRQQETLKCPRVESRLLWWRKVEDISDGLGTGALMCNGQYADIITGGPEQRVAHETSFVYHYIRFLRLFGEFRYTTNTHSTQSFLSVDLSLEKRTTSPFLWWLLI